MAHDPLTASTTLCLAGPAGHGKSLLVRRLHEEPGDALSGKLGTTTSRLRTPRRQWLAIDARHESELLREIVGGGIEAPVALVVVDVRNPAATAVTARNTNERRRMACSVCCCAFTSILDLLPVAGVAVFRPPLDRRSRSRQVFGAEEELLLHVHGDDPPEIPRAARARERVVHGVVRRHRLRRAVHVDRAVGRARPRVSPRR